MKSNISRTFFLLYNFTYQIKKSLRLKLFDLKVLKYLYRYLVDNLHSNYSNLENEMPWITYSSIDKLNKLLNIEMKVFEFGSGGSTLYYSKRVKEIVSVEHEPDWSNNVENIIKAQKIKNIKILLRKAESHYNRSFSDLPYSSTMDKKYSGFAFNNYVNTIDEFPDHYFDLIVIDGRARPYCLKHSLIKLKQGGFIVYDNVERLSYQDETFFSIKNWKIHTGFHPVAGSLSFSITNIYQKPII